MAVHWGSPEANSPGHRNVSQTEREVQYRDDIGRSCTILIRGFVPEPTDQAPHLRLGLMLGGRGKISNRLVCWVRSPEELAKLGAALETVLAEVAKDLESRTQAALGNGQSEPAEPAEDLPL